jgi:hypothetical protein
MHDAFTGAAHKTLPTFRIDRGHYGGTPRHARPARGPPLHGPHSGAHVLGVNQKGVVSIAPGHHELDANGQSTSNMPAACSCGWTVSALGTEGILGR